MAVFLLTVMLITVQFNTGSMAQYPENCQESYDMGHTSSGVHTLQTATGDSFQVYCLFESQTSGYVFPGRQAVDLTNTSQLDLDVLSNDRTHAMWLERHTNGTTHQTVVRQLDQFAGINLTFEHNSWDHFGGPSYISLYGNTFIFFGFLNLSFYEDNEDDPLGLTSNGVSVTYSQCGTNRNSEAVFFSAPHTSTCHLDQGKYDMPENLHDSFITCEHSEIMDDEDYWFALELSFGGCGMLYTSYDCPGIAGYAVGLPFDFIKEPKFTDVWPTFGPEAGGTNMTISGQDFISSVEMVYLGSNMQYICTIIATNSTAIIAATPSSNDTGVLLEIYVNFSGIAASNTGFSFEYKPDPVITKVEPLETLIEGGILLTVSGNSFNSVARPEIEVTMSLVIRREIAPDNNTVNETRMNFREVCRSEDITNETMLCPTPAMNISVSTPQLASVPENINSLGLYLKYVQDVPEMNADEANVTFYLGFILDGVETYRNLSDHAELRQYSELTVYRAPTLTYPPGDGVIEFDEGQPLIIQGENMDRGVSENDYKIEIGAGLCQVTDLLDDSLFCLPPQETPEKRHNSTSEYHRIVVHIGLNLHYDYGQMKYPSLMWLWILCGSFCAICVTSAVTALVVVVFRDKRQKTRQRAPAEGSAHTEDSSSEIIDLGTINPDIVNDVALSLSPKHATATSKRITVDKGTGSDTGTTSESGSESGGRSSEEQSTESIKSTESDDEYLTMETYTCSMTQ